MNVGRELVKCFFVFALLTMALGAGPSTRPVFRSGPTDEMGLWQLESAESEGLFISDDAELERMGLTGLGTESDPYVIEDLEIVANGLCIELDYISSSFIIRNCTRVSLSPGPATLIQACHNGTIESCSIDASGLEKTLRFRELLIHSSSLGVRLSYQRGLE